MNSYHPVYPRESNIVKSHLIPVLIHSSQFKKPAKNLNFGAIDQSAVRSSCAANQNNQKPRTSFRRVTFLVSIWLYYPIQSQNGRVALASLDTLSEGDGLVTLHTTNILLKLWIIKYNFMERTNWKKNDSTSFALKKTVLVCTFNF